MSWNPGDRCQCNWRNQGQWYPGTIMRGQLLGISDAGDLEVTYTIEFDDGDLESAVPEIRIRPPKTTDIIPTVVAQIAHSTNLNVRVALLPSRRFKVGDQILMRQDNAWVAGLVETINPSVAAGATTASTTVAYRVMSKKTQTDLYELTLIKEDTNKFIRQPDGTSWGSFLKQTNNTQEEEIASKQPPPSLRCCITQELMNDPVFASDGHSYDRTALETWFESGKRTSPSTNLPITRTLTTNWNLKQQIQTWARQDKNGQEYQQQIQMYFGQLAMNLTTIKEVATVITAIRGTVQLASSRNICIIGAKEMTRLETLTSASVVFDKNPCEWNVASQHTITDLLTSLRTECTKSIFNAQEQHRLLCARLIVLESTRKQQDRTTNLLEFQEKQKTQLAVVTKAVVKLQEKYERLAVAKDHLKPLEKVLEYAQQDLNEARTAVNGTADAKSNKKKWNTVQECTMAVDQIKKAQVSATKKVSLTLVDVKLLQAEVARARKAEAYTRKQTNFLQIEQPKQIARRTNILNSLIQQYQEEKDVISDTLKHVGSRLVPFQCLAPPSSTSSSSSSSTSANVPALPSNASNANDINANHVGNKRVRSTDLSLPIDPKRRKVVAPPSISPEKVYVSRAAQLLFDEGYSYFYGTEFQKINRERGRTYIEAAAASDCAVAIIFCQLVEHMDPNYDDTLYDDLGEYLDCWCGVELDTLDACTQIVTNPKTHYEEMMFGTIATQSEPFPKVLDRYRDFEGWDGDETDEELDMWNENERRCLSGNETEARQKLVRAASQGNTHAMITMSKLDRKQPSLHSFWGTDNHTLEVDWMEKAAKAGDSYARCQLGEIYLRSGPMKNTDVARKWLRMAEQQGHTVAKNLLAKLDLAEQVAEDATFARAFALGVQRDVVGDY